MTPEPGMNPEPSSKSERGRTPPDFLLELFTNALDPGYAEAAARRAGRERRRSWAGLTARVVSLLVVGLLLIFQ